MKYTPIYQLPYVEDGDRARAYPAATKTMAERIEAAMLQNGQVPVGADAQGIIKRLNAIDSLNTPWTAIKLAAGITAGDSLAVRVQNGMVQWRGQIINGDGSVAFPNGYTVVGTLADTAFYPSAYFRVPVAMYSGLSGLLVINASTGVIQIGISTSVGTAANVYVGGVSYPSART